MRGQTFLTKITHIELETIICRDVVCHVTADRIRNNLQNGNILIAIDNEPKLQSDGVTLKITKTYALFENPTELY